MWRLLFGALIFFIIYRAPVHCDLDTLQHCNNKETEKITNLKTKTTSELELLLEMKHAELEIIQTGYLKKFNFIHDELDLLMENLHKYKEHVQEENIIHKLLLKVK